jgi:hypothetical protein
LQAGDRDLDCIDFDYQEEPQAVYDEDPSDPYDLDPNGDGFARTSFPSREPGIVELPRTGTGHGVAAANDRRDRRATKRPRR